MTMGFALGFTLGYLSRGHIDPTRGFVTFERELHRIRNNNTNIGITKHRGGPVWILFHDDYYTNLGHLNMHYGTRPVYERRKSFYYEHAELAGRHT